MSPSQLLFFFIVLPIIYTVLVATLAIIVTSAIGSVIKQAKYAEYGAKLGYEQEKAKIGQEAAEKVKASYAKLVTP